jgi:hypothetical protein
MNRISQTLVVPAGVVPTFLEIAAAHGPGTLSDAWTVMVGPDATTETHQITSGLVAEGLLPAIANLDGIVVSPDDAATVMAAMGLQFQQSDEVLA